MKVEIPLANNPSNKLLKVNEGHLKVNKKINSKKRIVEKSEERQLTHEDEAYFEDQFELGEDEKYGIQQRIPTDEGVTENRIVHNKHLEMQTNNDSQ